MANSTVEAAVILTFFFVLSLIGAYVALRLLRGSAMIHRKGVQLGGAAAMFVVMFFLLNRYLPEVRDGLVREAQAAAQPIQTRKANGETQTVQLHLSLATQLTTELDLRRLDRNEYQIRIDDGFAVPIPSSRELMLTELTDVNFVGIADVPAFGQSYEIMKILLNLKSPKVVAVQTRKANEIEISMKSRVGGVPASFSYFDDDNYVKAAIRASAQMFKGMGIKFGMKDPEIQKSAFDMIKKTFQSQMSKSIQDKLPATKKVRSGVFIIPLTEDILNINLINKFSSYYSLDKAMMFLQGTGYLGSMTFGNLYMNQKQGIASFNTSTTLESVRYNGRYSDLRINNVGFLVAGKQRTFLVLLSYLSKDDVQIFVSLSRILNGLRFAG